MNLHDAMLWRANTDKAHRCPCRSLPLDHPRVCPDGYVPCEETDWVFRRFHVYRCNNCGMRVTTFPGWPHYPGTERYWSRFSWFWTRGIRYKFDNAVYEARRWLRGGRA